MPGFVEGFPLAERVFTKPQLKRLARYPVRLLVCEDKAFTGINSSFKRRNDQSALNHR